MMLRPATLEDADLLFQWRNDPETRKNSHNTEEVPYENHIAWLRSSLSNSRRKLLIAVTEVPIGTVRYDWQEENPSTVELSWTVAPEQRGKGLGTQMVAEAIKNHQGTFVAQIKDSNTPSIAIARSNGFIPLSKNGEVTRWMRFAYKSNLDYHLRQYTTPYRSTHWLIDYLKRIEPTKKIRTVLDMGCGGGANIYWLKQAFPQWTFTGVDFDPEAVKMARDQNPHAKIFCEDILNLKDVVANGPYDLILSIQVVATAPFDLYTFLDITRPIAKKDIVITSLFSEEYFEQETIRRDLKKGMSYIYKIDSLKKLADYTRDKNIALSWEEIKIDADIPKPEPLTLSTYTIRTDDGERLQVSPYMLMPWYAVHLAK